MSLKDLGKEFVGAMGRRGFLQTLAAVVTALSLPWSRARAKKVGLKMESLKELEKVGGWKAVKIKETDVILVRKSETEVVAFDPTCTHKNCKVKFQPEDNIFFCKCHKSEYELIGKVKKGPAKEPLKAFVAELSGDKVILTLPDDPA